jgi:hypothetical protein
MGLEYRSGGSGIDRNAGPGGDGVRTMEQGKPECYLWALPLLMVVMAENMA